MSPPFASLTTSVVSADAAAEFAPFLQGLLDSHGYGPMLLLVFIVLVFFPRWGLANMLAMLFKEDRADKRKRLADVEKLRLKLAERERTAEAERQHRLEERTHGNLPSSKAVVQIGESKKAGNMPVKSPDGETK